MRKTSLSIVILILFASPIMSQQKNTSFNSYFFDRLLQIPPQMQVLQTSSHNKTGMNWDEYWPQYTDENGDEVIFDVAGPGCVKSMWGTNFDSEAILKFYFDGEEKPGFTINYIDFYKGKLEGFPSPLTSYERRGNYGDQPFAGNSFVPIPFEKHLKITVEGIAHFYHIIYEKYPAGKQALRSLNSRINLNLLSRAFEKNSEPPIDIDQMKKISFRNAEGLEPGKLDTLFYVEGSAAVIRGLILEADGSDEFFQDVQIKMRWDGSSRYQVNSPAGIFFGSSHHANDMHSLPLRITKLGDGRVKLESYFPMAFREKAEIVIMNKSNRSLGPIEGTLFLGQNTIPPDKGTYFCTSYREGKTVYGQDWSLFEGEGTGWYVGTVQSMQHQHYCEGDEHFIIDGVISPQINGTGTEDYYLACFWPNPDFDMPFACVVGDVAIEGGGAWSGYYAKPACYNRFHLDAPIPFFKSISAKIQHGGLSHIESNYKSLSFVYLQKRVQIKQTDFIDIGNSQSEKQHSYHSNGTQTVTLRETSPEGEFFETRVENNGRHHTTDTIRFQIAIDPGNTGVRIRRLLDQQFGPQAATVFVDGTDAGIWYHGYRNETLGWYEHDFDFPPILTRDKTTLQIMLVIADHKGRISYSDFNYTVYCFLPTKEKN